MQTKTKFGFLDYADKIRLAKLDGGAKGLLWFYASTFNWRNKKPSYYTERSICALTGMSLGTYHVRRKYLEELGWISVYHKGKHNTAHVGLKVGNDDPDYETKCWAEWHPSKRNQIDDEIVWDHDAGQFISKNQPKNAKSSFNSIEMIEIDGFLLPKRKENLNFPLPENAIIDFYRNSKILDKDYEISINHIYQNSEQEDFDEILTPYEGDDFEPDWDSRIEERRASTMVEW
jgi:hypothetical protein